MADLAIVMSFAHNGLDLKLQDNSDMIAAVQEYLTVCMIKAIPYIQKTHLENGINFSLLLHLSTRYIGILD